MIDLEVVDALFEHGRASGAEIGWFIFDKRMLMPLRHLPGAVLHETNLSVSEDDLRQFAEDGWIPLLPGAGVDGAELGSPLYVPSRVGLIFELRHRGYAKEEIRCVADFEENLIDNVLTTDESAYIDDDLDMLIAYTEGMIDGCIRGRSVDIHGQLVDRSDERAIHEKRLKMLQRYRESGIPPHREVEIAKYAYRVRAFGESVRLFMLEEDRAQIKAGYSPTVMLRSRSWSANEKTFRGYGIYWEESLRCAVAHAEGDVVRIRVPGFILESERVTTSRTFSPKEYAAAWKEHDLDGYLHALAELNSEKRCLHCLEVISAEADRRRRYCDEKCRNAAKQKRFRQHNPEAVFRSQKRYYESVD